MYRLFNILFGWDYIYWSNSCDTGISRVFKDAEGNPVYWRYRSTRVLDKADGTCSQITWLTCPRSKYIKEDK